MSPFLEGFLLKCAQEGLTREEVEFLIKEAQRPTGMGDELYQQWLAEGYSPQQITDIWGAREGARMAGGAQLGGQTQQELVQAPATPTAQYQQRVSPPPPPKKPTVSDVQGLGGVQYGGIGQGPGN